jgi:PAS domain S-box-containing protein
MKRLTIPGVALAAALCTPLCAAPASEPALQVSQYAHTSWTVREGYSPGLVFAIAQTADGYLWLAGEFGLFRFDGLRFTPWQPPAGQELPSKPYSLLVSRDGILWIGTFEGLSSWNGRDLVHYPEIDKGFVTSLLQDREGTVWAGVLGSPGRLCQISRGQARCHSHQGAFGAHVWSLAEDAAGALWVGADSGLWRWRPGDPEKFDTGKQIGDLITSADGTLLAGMRGAGLRRFAGNRLETLALRKASRPAEVIADLDVKSNKLLRDRDGGIWIGTDDRGLLHVRDGQADSFAKGDGLSGNIACALFEDREGNIWFASERGLDRFRKLAITTFSTQQGLSNDATKSVVATADGSVWVASSDGVTRWKDFRPTVFRAGQGLPDVAAQSLFEDSKGVMWVTTNRGLAYFDGRVFQPVDGLPSREVSSITEGPAGTLWLSGNAGLARVQQGRSVDNIPWASLGRRQQAKVVVADQRGVWLGFWMDGGVLYLEDGKLRARYTAEQGLGKGHISGLRLDRQGAVWAATEEGGLSRIHEGRISTLTVRNGLPCDTIHWSIEDDRGQLWLYSACGLVRISGGDLSAWLADPHHRVTPQVWGASDGVVSRAVTPAYFNPPVAKASDGKLWFVWGDGLQMLDPGNLPFNPIPPPVYIERVVADRQVHAAANGLRLPPLVRDVTLEFTALSLIDPAKVRFRYRLDGHDEHWREVIDRREVTYSNLPPGNYLFALMAANDSGVWNDQPVHLEFSIAPAFHQTLWFRVACIALLVALIAGGLHLRVRRLRREEKRLRKVIEGIPAMAFSVHPDGTPDLVNQRWLEYSGLTKDTAAGAGWESTIHPDDVHRHVSKWREALASGAPFENEARHRSATGQYRWFLVQALPLRDPQGRIVKWYGTLMDIEERKRAEEERERLRRLESHLAHTNRLSMLGELTASLAHEINQPIGAVIASAGASLRWLDREQPELQRAREAITRIKDDGKRAADIIAGLKAFYRKEGSPQRTLLDVNEVVGEMLVLLRGEAERHAVSMRTQLAPELPAVRADRVQLQQVLMNLMVNGIEAMGPAGGKLVICTSRSDDGVKVSVSDTGPGIPADKLEHIFNAFVTTKPAGTGMGLAISRTIVESHEGRLWAEAGAGVGATFHFTLPAAPQAGVSPESVPETVAATSPR